MENDICTCEICGEYARTRNSMMTYVISATKDQGIL